MSRESRDEWEARVCNLFYINIYIGVYVMYFVRFSTKIVCGAPGQSSLKKHIKPRLSRESRDEWESRVCNLFYINIYIGVYVMNFFRFNTRIVPCPVYIFEIRFSVAANSYKKSQGCLPAIEHANAFSHSHTLHHHADGINP